MNYLDTYFARVNHLGETTAERIRNGGIRSFEKWMEESPHTIRNLSVERGIYFDGIILTNKDKEERKIMFLNVANDIPIVIGDIMNWVNDSGVEEKWLLFQEEKKVNGTYKTYWIIRCNYLFKWIDDLGHLQQSWGYIVSSVDSKIKGNFRTWNNLITPQPNKYAEILMPRYPISRSTNFIVEEESWMVVEYDHTSVPGVIYLSLTENKINSIYDDVINNIADTDKLAQYAISAPIETQNFMIGNPINPSFTLTKNGKPFDAEVELLPTDKKIARIINDQLIAVGAGETEIKIQLKEFPNIFTTINIIVNEQEKVISYYIEGPDTIRLNRKAIYELKGNSEVTGEVQFSINDISLANFAKNTNEENKLLSNQCEILTNRNNKLGQFELIATYDNKEYKKEISVIPLW